jgi:hypothetical protein
MDIRLEVRRIMLFQMAHTGGRNYYEGSIDGIENF